MESNLSILDKKLSIVVAVLAIIGTLSGWAFGIHKNNLLQFQKGILGSPKLITAKVEYINETKEQEKAWREIWSRLLPVCIRDSNGQFIEITQQLSPDAEAKFFLRATPDTLKGAYNFSGLGSYTESLKIQNSGRIPLLWGVEIRSSKSKTKDQILAGTDIPIIITQRGQGEVIEFESSLKASSQGFIEETVPIFYGKIQIARLIILNGSDL